MADQSRADGLGPRKVWVSMMSSCQHDGADLDNSAEVSRTTTEQLSGRASLLGTRRSERIGKTMKPH
jgi:hypothetical protein